MCREYLNIVAYNTQILLWIKNWNSLIYRTVFYVNIYGTYKLSKKTVQFLSILYTYVLNKFLPPVLCGWNVAIRISEMIKIVPLKQLSLLLGINTAKLKLY